MAIANRTNRTIEPNITQDVLVSEIRTAFYELVYDPLDQFDDGSDKVLVFYVFTDFESNYGISYLKIRVTADLAISYQLFARWDSQNHTGEFGSEEVTNSPFSPATAIAVTILLAQNELKFVLLQQGPLFIPLGYLSPVSRPDWWSTNTYSYCFIPTNGTFGVWRTTGKQPFTSTDHDSFLTSPRLAGATPVSNRRDILQGICLFSLSNQGISGRTSDDLVIVAALGSARYDIIVTPDTREYLILSPTAGGFAVRIA